MVFRLKRAALIVIGLILFLAIVYVVLPISVYKRKFSIATFGGNAMQESFSIPLLKFKLEIKMRLHFVGLLNVTIVDSVTNATVFSWEKTTFNEETYDVLSVADVVSGRKYYIVFVTALGAYNIDVDLVAYTIHS